MTEATRTSSTGDKACAVHAVETGQRRSCCDLFTISRKHTDTQQYHSQQQATYTQRMYV